VATNIDLRNQIAVDSAEGKARADQLGMPFIEFSAKDGTNRDELLCLVVKKALAQVEKRIADEEKADQAKRSELEAREAAERAQARRDFWLAPFRFAGRVTGGIATALSSLQEVEAAPEADARPNLWDGNVNNDNNNYNNAGGNADDIESQVKSPVIFGTFWKGNQ
jgi:hypothetical protein